MKIRYAVMMLLCAAWGLGGSHAVAGPLELGAGLGFVNARDSDGFEGGWDLMAGYEALEQAEWNFGGQVQFIRGWTGKNRLDQQPSDTTMYFESASAYATARRGHAWFDWLQFKAGLVSASFKSGNMEGSGSGVAVGAGVVLGDELFRFHLLDVQEFLVAGHRFTVYSVSVAIIADMFK